MAKKKFSPIKRFLLNSFEWVNLTCCKNKKQKIHKNDEKIRKYWLQWKKFTLIKKKYYIYALSNRKNKKKKIIFWSNMWRVAHLAMWHIRTLLSISRYVSALRLSVHKRLQKISYFTDMNDKCELKIMQIHTDGHL